MEGPLIGWARELLRVDGRLSRLQFWKSNLRLVLLGALAVVVGMGAVMVLGKWGSVFLLPIFAVLFASMAIIIRRLHDRNKSALWLLPFVAFPLMAGIWINAENHGAVTWTALLVALTSIVLNVWGFVDVGLRRGTLGPNRFGDEPGGS